MSADAQGGDYDDAARRLFAQLDQAVREPQALASSYRNLDCVFEHPESGARVYIGNIDAARGADILDRQRITRVVNCQDPTSQNFHERNPRFKYLRFPVAWWQKARGMDSAEGVLRFFGPVFDFVDDAMARRENVLIHCLAGAHRAGTTGVAVVMHLSGKDAAVALAECRHRRPAVDPIMSLGELLMRLDQAMTAAKGAHNVSAFGHSRAAQPRGSSALQGRGHHQRHSGREEPVEVSVAQSRAGAAPLCGAASPLGVFGGWLHIGGCCRAP